MSEIYYFNPRPKLVVEVTNSGSLGRSYSFVRYRVTSTDRIKHEILVQLGKMGILAGGQEFRVLSPCDGKEAPVGHDEVPGTEVLRDGTRRPATDPKTWKAPYWVYEVETRCDSSD